MHGALNSGASKIGEPNGDRDLMIDPVVQFVKSVCNPIAHDPGILGHLSGIRRDEVIGNGGIGHFLFLTVYRENMIEGTSSRLNPNAFNANQGSDREVVRKITF
jgi:hypothetical protein